MTRPDSSGLFSAAHSFAEMLATPTQQVDAMHSYAVEVSESPRPDVQTVWMLWSDSHKRFMRIVSGKIVIDAKHHGLAFHSLQAALQFMPDLIAEMSLVPVQVAIAGHHIYTQIGVDIERAATRRNLHLQMVPIILMRLTRTEAYWQSILTDVPPVPLLFADKQSSHDTIAMISSHKHHVSGIPNLVNPTRLNGAVISGGTYRTLTYFRRAALPVTKMEASQRVVLLN